MRATSLLNPRTLRRVGGAAVAVTGAALAVGSVASAHITIVEQSAAAGSYTVLTFSVPHGCDGEATTGVRIQVPESIPSVTPTVNPNWDVEKVMEELDTPIEGGHGEQITERVAEVAYTAKVPLEDGLRDTFELSLQLPADAAGTTIWFPVIQECGATESPWIEIPEEGGAEPEQPAPGIEVTAASDEGGHDDETTATTVADDAAPVTTTAGDDASGGSSDESSDDGSSNGWGIAGLGTGAAGLAVGAVALARTRRT